MSVHLVHLELKASSETNECEREPGHLTDRFLKSLRSWLLLAATILNSIGIILALGIVNIIIIVVVVYFIPDDLSSWEKQRDFNMCMCADECFCFHNELSTPTPKKNYHIK